MPSTTAPIENQSHSEVEQAALNNQSQGVGLLPGKLVPKPQINSQQVLGLVAAKEARIGESIRAR
jgi:hypothetical protein